MRVTNNPEVQAKVKDIRKVAADALNKYNAFEFGAGDTVEETFSNMRDDMYLTINHAQGIATHYNKVIVIISSIETERMTSIFFPLPGCDFQGSLSLWDRDMSSYHVSLKDKFSNDVNINDFLQYANDVLHMNITADTPAIEVMKIALRSGDTIAYTTEGRHSKSLQMQDRRGLKDYVPPFSEVNDKSIKALDKEIPAVINDNELNITKEKVSVNSAKVNRILKYLKLMRQFKLTHDEDEYIKNKDYREASIMEVDGENYMKRYKDYKDADEEQIREKIEKQVKIEEEKEKKDKLNANVIVDSITAIAKEVPSVISDNELNIIKEKVKVNKPKKNTKSLMTVDDLLLCVKLMDYFNLAFNSYDFIHDKQYREKRIKYINDKNLLQKYNNLKHTKKELEDFGNFDEDEIQAVLDRE
jgi:hypothetical protein